MAKASITKNYKVTASGILSIEDNIIGIENADTGEFVKFSDLMSDFNDKTVRVIVSYDEDYLSE